MRSLIWVFLVFGAISVHGQYDHEAVFEGESGEVLRQMVVDGYKPNVVLTYGPARDTMYGIIYNVNDSIAGIYSDHKVYLQPGEDPSTFIFMNGVANGINAEHSYPQSKGAGNGNGRSDMHHLFPSRVNVNSARGSLPFGEINDNITDVWYYKTQEKSSIPSSDVIDEFSEKSNTFFEPREEVKGNIARAIMYFYTMYKQEADAADPGYFSSMQDVLCMWHDLDPVDELEWNRTKMIANWQDGKENPFVLDCTLASRIYCGDVSAACTAVDVIEIVEEKALTILENPVRDFLVMNWNKEGNKDGAFAQREIISYSITDAQGRSHVINKAIASYDQSNQGIEIPVNFLPAGFYTIQLIIAKDNTRFIVPYRFIKTP